MLCQAIETCCVAAGCSNTHSDGVGLHRFTNLKVSLWALNFANLHNNMLAHSTVTNDDDVGLHEYSC